ncbi:MAG: hypothetical protein RJB13_318, partial [Pseudomonadota bacterium]
RKTQFCLVHNVFNSNSPDISVIFEGDGGHNLPESKKKDEGQREVKQKHPIELEFPVPHSSKRDYLALLWSPYNSSNTREKKSKIPEERFAT